MYTAGPDTPTPVYQHGGNYGPRSHSPGEPHLTPGGVDTDGLPLAPMDTRGEAQPQGPISRLIPRAKARPKPYTQPRHPPPPQHGPPAVGKENPVFEDDPGVHRWKRTEFDPVTGTSKVYTMGCYRPADDNYRPQYRE